MGFASLNPSYPSYGLPETGSSLGVGVGFLKFFRV
jgi:hypothetical protein